MYTWRKMSPEERDAAFIQRVGRNLPWHSLPHLDFTGSVTFIITAARFEHSHIIGKDVKRIAGLESDLLSICESSDTKLFGWCVLPNHYHLLVRTKNIKQLRREIGKIHGRSARAWNIEDNAVGRQVWFNFFDRDINQTDTFGPV
jgi:putative transposase